MNCTTPGLFDEQIGEYVDRTLHGPARAAFEAHLSSCAACRSVVADFHAIRAAASTLEPHVPPPQVWQALSARVAPAPPRGRFASWFPGWQPLAASAMLVLMVSGLWWIGSRLSPAGADAEMVALGGADIPNGDAALPADPIAAAEAQYSSAIVNLEQIARAEQDTLDPGTADVLQANLIVLDTAIVESRTALASEPDSDVARESLFEALRSKVALLQDTIALINEMRKGNGQGAARIVSGLNQPRALP